jgi:methyltransferase (TIGR00027 family)
MPGERLTEWVMALRTQAIDRLVMSAIARGADTILNLGAGLDTRPYRLELPKALRWIEVDFPAIIELKERTLGGHTPKCRLEHIALDLSQEEQRQAALAKALEGSRKTAVLTEGVLVYLSHEEVDSLAKTLRGLPAVQYWIADYHKGGAPAARKRELKHRLRSAPWRFEILDWFGYFAERGFHVAEDLLLAEEARRLRRLPPKWYLFMLGHLFSSKKQREFNRTQSGWVLLEKRS